LATVHDRSPVLRSEIVSVPLRRTGETPVHGQHRRKRHMRATPSRPRTFQRTRVRRIGQFVRRVQHLEHAPPAAMRALDHVVDPRQRLIGPNSRHQYARTPAAFRS
jgi:hypothetical protein